jgi:hypothetical protein
MPEWYLVIALLALVSLTGVFWTPALLAAPLLAGAIGALLVDAGLGAARARFESHTHTASLRALTGLLYLLQPLERLRGRLMYGLTPWRRRGESALVLPREREETFWSERWQGTEERVNAIERSLREQGAVVRSGGPWDRWDLGARGGMLGSARLRLAIEEHGAGHQLVRARVWPHVSRRIFALLSLLVAVTAFAAIEGRSSVGILFGVSVLAILARAIYECAVSVAAVRGALPCALTEPAVAEQADDERSDASVPKQRLAALRSQASRSAAKPPHRSELVLVERADRLPSLASPSHAAAQRANPPRRPKATPDRG